MVSKNEVKNEETNTPPLTAVNINNCSKKKKDGSLSPVTMDTSVTLTPIRSETGNPGGNTRSNYGRNLGIIVVPDINNNVSSSVGGQFSVIDSSQSMSMSTTKH